MRPIGQFALMGPENELRANGAAGGSAGEAEDDGADIAAISANPGPDEDAPRPQIRVQFFNPPARFDGCFSALYRLTLDFEGATDPDQRPAPKIADYIQPGWAALRFHTGGLPSSQIAGMKLKGAHFTVNGPSSLPCWFEMGRTQMWGIGLFPLGWARFVAADACDFTNHVFDGAAHPVFERFDSLSPIVCNPAHEPEEQLDAIMAGMGDMMRPTRDDAKIIRVHRALIGGDHATVGELADAGGISIRTLERVCHRFFGFTPKLLLRRQRFMRSLRNFMLDQSSSRTGRWTEAMDAEYHDQAQFTREFTAFMTMTPSAYASLEHPVLSAFVEARARHRAAQTQHSGIQTG